MEILKKNIKYICMILIAVVVLVLIGCYNLTASDNVYKKGIKKKSNNNKKYDTSIVLNNTDVLSQTFVAKRNNLEKIKIVFDDDDKTKSGKITFTLNNLTENKIVDTQTITYYKNTKGGEKTRYTIIGTDLEYEYVFERQSDSKGKEYRLDIQFSDIEGNENSKGEFLQIKASSKLKYQTREMYLNGEYIEQNIDINEAYFVPNRIKIFYGVLILVSITVTILAIFLLFIKDIKPEKVFLFTVPIICCIYIVCIPMFTGHDEQRHWLRAYEISEGHFLTETHGEDVGTYLPKSVVEGIENLKWDEIKYSNVVKWSSKRLKPDKRKLESMNNVAVYSPIQYIPQSIGIFLARLITNRVIVLAYAARIANAIVTILILYLAIKKMPFGKNIILLFSYIPIVIEGISTMSADGITLSICFLFIASIFALREEKEKYITKTEIVKLMVMAIIIALCKIVYLPIIGLLLLIPKEKFKNKKHKAIIITLIWIIGIVCSLGWLMIASGYLEVQTSGSSSSKIMEILQHPIAFVQKLLYSMNLDGQGHFISMFGGLITWKGVSLLCIVPYILYSIFSMLVLTDSNFKNKLNKFDKFIIILIIVSIVLLTYTSLYLHWTDDDDFKIIGVQGRYYIPFIPLLIILLGGSLKIENGYKEKDISRLIAIIGTILQLYAAIQLVIDYM